MPDSMRCTEEISWEEWRSTGENILVIERKDSRPSAPFGIMHFTSC